MGNLVVVYPESKHIQDPAYTQTLDGRDIIVDKRGLPKFFLDGSPFKKNGRHQCIGKNHRTNYRCGRYAVVGTTVCQVHGAGSPLQGRPAIRRNTALPYARHLPKDLLSRYEDAAGDEKLLTLVDEIALIRTRVTMLLEQLKDPEELSVDFKALIDAAIELKKAHMVGDTDAVVKILPSIIQAVDPINKDMSMWDELTGLFKDRAKLVSAEIEHRKVMKYYITSEEAAAIVEGIVQIIHKNVSDQSIKNIIAEEIRRLFAAKATIRVSD